MSVTLKIDGLEELRRKLLALPTELQADAETVVKQAARDARDAIVARYEQHRSSTGYYVPKAGIRRPRRHLADSVRIDEQQSGKGSAYARVVVDAPHAHLFEFGTNERQWDKNGKSTGAAEAHPTVVPVAIRSRRAMVQELKAVVESAGLEVRGA